MGASVASRSSMTSMACRPRGPRSISRRRSGKLLQAGLRGFDLLAAAGGRPQLLTQLAHALANFYSRGAAPSVGAPEVLAVLVQLLHHLTRRSQEVERRPAEHAVLDALPGARVHAQRLVLRHRVQIGEHRARQPANPCDGTVCQIMQLAVDLNRPLRARREPAGDAHAASVTQIREQRAPRKAPVPRAVRMVRGCGGREAEERGRQEFEERRLARLVVAGHDYHVVLGQAVLRPAADGPECVDLPAVEPHDVSESRSSRSPAAVSRPSSSSRRYSRRATPSPPSPPANWVGEMLSSAASSVAARASSSSV